MTSCYMQTYICILVLEIGCNIQIDDQYIYRLIDSPTPHLYPYSLTPHLYPYSLTPHLRTHMLTPHQYTYSPTPHLRTHILTHTSPIHIFTHTSPIHVRICLNLTHTLHSYMQYFLTVHTYTVLTHKGLLYILVLGVGCNFQIDR